MAFITKTDLYPFILQDELDEITRGDDTFVESAISAAVAEMRTYLYDSYDVDTIFAKTGNDRHALLVNFAADIAIWFLIARSQAGQAIDDRKARYDRAVAWLKQAQKSQTYSDLERREENVQKHISYGSNEKRKNHY